MRIESISILPRAALPTAPLYTGTTTGPGVPALGVDNVSLLRDGKRWLGVMGEIHYSRVDPSLWESSLARMKACGLDVIASYVFWIHHEEIEGEFDFTGSRDLRRFVQVCAALRLPLMVRVGPWCHGEVRNGGLPDWVLDRQPRTLHEPFMKAVRKLYEEIAKQLRGLLWKDGGPVIGIQLDNEFGGPAEYLIELKRIARDVGFDVPFYTRTGWPSTSTPMPFGEMLPLYGAYAEGFWDRALTSMPGHYWKAFCFESLRTDIQIGMDQLGERPATDDIDTPQYPYLTCELGGGMETSYHRRLKIDPLDVLSTAVVKVGSGSNLPGYYMFHGGVNPVGKRTTLQETQATKYWNDVAERGYDFQAPLGSFGQARPHYHKLRRLHLFLNEFGETLANYPPHLPAKQPTSKEDVDTLRWSVRSDGRAGFLFVNNHQRSTMMPAKPNVQFRIELADGSTLSVPGSPVTIPSDAICIWPLNLDLRLANLRHATAQLICSISDGESRTYFFAACPGIESEFEVELGANVSLWQHGVQRSSGVLRAVPDDHEPAFELRHRDGRIIRVVLLNEVDSAGLWRVRQGERDYVILTEAELRADAGGTLCAERLGGVSPEFALRIFPSPQAVTCDGEPIELSGDGFARECGGRFEAFVTPRRVETRLVREAGALRAIALGSAGVAEAPAASDFESAASYEIDLPVDVNRSRSLLRFAYVGDVIRVSAGETLILDGFYNGQPFDLALHLVPRDVKRLQIAILPLQKSAPIYIDPAARPEGISESGLARLDRVDLLKWAEAKLQISG